MISAFSNVWVIKNKTQVRVVSILTVGQLSDVHIIEGVISGQNIKGSSKTVGGQKPLITPFAVATSSTGGIVLVDRVQQPPNEHI